MSQKGRVSPSFQSIKSLPVDLRLRGLPNSQHLLEKSGGGIASERNVVNGEVMSDAMEEGVNGNVDVENDESPYSSLSLSAEERPSVGDGLIPENSSVQSTGRSHVESKWTDTKSYSVKKVFVGSFSISLGMML